MPAGTKLCFCRILVTTEDVFCRDKHVFVTTKLLSRQKLYLWQLPPVTDMMQQTGSSMVYSAALLQDQPKQPAKVVLKKGLWPLVMESHAWNGNTKEMQYNIKSDPLQLPFKQFVPLICKIQVVCTFDLQDTSSLYL